MDIKEKLVELIQRAVGGCARHWASLIADHLIANGVTVQEWIPVTERLPDLELVEAKANDIDLYPCLVTVKDKRAKNGRYVGKAWYDGDQFIDSDCVDITYDVTHWMPLPEPPKGE